MDAFGQAEKKPPFPPPQHHWTEIGSSRLHPQLDRWDVTLAGSAASQALACRVLMAGPCWWRLRSASHQHRGPLYLEGMYHHLELSSRMLTCWGDRRASAVALSRNEQCQSKDTLLLPF